MMKKECLNETGKLVGEPIVIADECGDSLWDEVLQQEIKACAVNNLSANASSLLHKIDAVHECDATKVK